MVNGNPRMLYLKLSINLKLKMHFSDLVRPHPGQGILNMLKKGQTLIFRKLAVRANPKTIKIIFILLIKLS